MRSNIGNINNNNYEIKEKMDKKKYYVIIFSDPQIDKNNKI